MEWLLLYVGIGVCLAPWMYWGERKHNQLHSGDPVVLMLLYVTFAWPVFAIGLPLGWKANKKEALKQEARDFEALLERVRREDRRRVRQEFAEFDKELGVETAPKQWRVGNPEAAAEYDRLMDEAQYRVRDIESGFSSGGYILSAHAQNWRL